MLSPRIKLLSNTLIAVTVLAALAWIVGSRIESPAEAAAKTAAPSPSPILVPVERRVLSSNVVTRGTARFGLPQPVSIAPSTLKPTAGLIGILPLRNTQIQEGALLLTASGRPVLVLQGNLPAFRDLGPGLSGDDVRQFEQALARLHFDPGPMDGLYDQHTAAAVVRWYKSKGWEPFGPTREQMAAVHTLERESGDAEKAALSARAAVASAAPAMEAARATAEHNTRATSVEVATRQEDLRAQEASREGDLALALQYERAKAEQANKAAETDLAAQIAEEALISLDPRQPETARLAALAKVDLARANAAKTRLEGRGAITIAERAAAQLARKIELAQVAERAARTAEKAAQLEGARAIRAVQDAQNLAQLDARLASQRAQQLAADLALARARLGVQVPVDEIVFVRTLPVRVEELKAAVGSPATGVILTVTDNQLSVDSSLPLEAAALVTPGMQVTIDEPALALHATGKVQQVANTPGTRGVDGFHIYFEVRVDPISTPLEGFSVRLTIPTKTTSGPVTAVPISALSLAADGSSRVQVQVKDALEYRVVTPGLAADGFVEVTPRNGKLEPGHMVVVGYNMQSTKDSPKP